MERSLDRCTRRKPVVNPSPQTGAGAARRAIMPRIGLPPVLITPRRVIRGGSFGAAPVNLRTGFRDSHPPLAPGPHVEFRCASSLTGTGRAAGAASGGEAER
jgi:hypothetical protein